MKNIRLKMCFLVLLAILLIPVGQALALYSCSSGTTIHAFSKLQVSNDWEGIFTINHPKERSFVLPRLAADSDCIGANYPGLTKYYPFNNTILSRPDTQDVSTLYLQDGDAAKGSLITSTKNGGSCCIDGILATCSGENIYYRVQMCIE